MKERGFVAYHSYLRTLEPLSDAEVGRLFRACLEYSETGTEPELRGNERIMWPTLKHQIDRDANEYREKCEKLRQNGMNGVRARKAKGNQTQPNGNQMVVANNQMVANENENENETISPYNPPVGDVEKKANKRFVKPTEDEVAAYCKERGNTISAAAFVAFYDSNGWRVGKNPMKDWKAAVRTWEQKRKKEAPPSQPKKEEYKLFKITDLSPEMRAKVELPPLW